MMILSHLDVMYYSRCEHVVPPWYIELHSQVNEPGVFVHVPPFWQGLLLHLSIAAETEETQKWCPS